MDEIETSFYGSVYSEGCPGCNRNEPQPEGLGIVLETVNFRVHQDYALPIPGMMVVETRRHIRSMTEFTADELSDLVSVLVRTREAMRDAGIEEAILVQEERSSHFHAWWLPIYPWIRDVAGGKIRNIQLIFDHAKKYMVTEGNIKKVEETIRRIKASLV
ncbi:MAG: hypothetical protein WC686_03345 [Candidatus Shapirobacteria bacterium]|jgi:diadenosine tetraphosphate (Ap4A) HIT family hydrolase